MPKDSADNVAAKAECGMVSLITIVGAAYTAMEDGGPYEPKYPTLRMISYDSYHPLSCI